jgi:hypothetical protein
MAVETALEDRRRTLARIAPQDELDRLIPARAGFYKDDKS